MKAPERAAPFPAPERVETVTHRGSVVCVLIRSEPVPENTRFYTPSDLPLQVGKIVYPAGSEIPRHTHRPVIRKIAATAEVLVVQKGRVILDVYGDDQAFVCRREMAQGDVIVLVTGGHGLRFLEDTVLLEVKQGPFMGDHEKEPF